MHVCKFARKRVCKSTSNQVCKYSGMELCRHVTIQVSKYTSKHLSKYVAIQVYMDARLKYAPPVYLYNESFKNYSHHVNIDGKYFISSGKYLYLTYTFIIALGLINQKGSYNTIPCTKWYKNNLKDKL